MKPLTEFEKSAIREAALKYSSITEDVADELIQNPDQAREFLNQPVPHVNDYSGPMSK